MRLDLKEVWSELKRDNYYISYTIMGLSSKNYKYIALMQDPLPYKEKSNYVSIGVYGFRYSNYLTIKNKFKIYDK